MGIFSKIKKGRKEEKKEKGRREEDKREIRKEEKERERERKRKEERRGKKLSIVEILREESFILTTLSILLTNLVN